MRDRRAFSLLELLIVIAIIAILGTLGAINGRRIAQDRTAEASLVTLQQSIWQGATAAASRGTTVELVRTGPELVLRDAASGQTIRTLELDGAVSTNLPEGVALRFLPPGKVDPATLSALPDDLTLTTENRTYRLDVSLIGEVRAEVSR